MSKLDLNPHRREHAGNYRPTSPVKFGTTLSGLRINYEDYLFVDFGSGKGRAILCASEFPFKKIIGIELSQELHRAAQENLKRHRLKTRKDVETEAIYTDAASYVIPSEPAVLYFFNPFDEVIMAKVLSNLRDSWLQNPRHLVLIYANPIHKHLVDNCDILRGYPYKVAYPSWAVYETRP